jgi:hypothetical protein
MTNQQNEGRQKNRTYKCELLCGCVATGIIKTSEKTDLYLCDACRRMIDPRDKMVWIQY